MTITCPSCGKELTVTDPDRKFTFCEYCGTKIDLDVKVTVNLRYSKSEHTEHIIDDAKIKAADNVNRVIGIFASPIEERRKEKAEAKRQEEEEEREEARLDAEETKRAEEAKRERKEKIMKGEYSFKEMLVDLFQSDFGKLLLFAILGLALTFGYIRYFSHQSDLREHQEKLDALAYESAAASRLAIGQASIPKFSSSDDARTFVKTLKDRGFVNVSSEEVPDLIAGISSKEYEIVEVLVDGAPDYQPDIWYPTDTDIVVRYHVYREGAKEAKDALIDRATNAAKGKAEDVVDGIGNTLDSLLS